MAVLGLRFCARALPTCGKRGPLPIAVRGPLTIAASPVAEHRLQTRRLSNYGSRAQLLCGTRDPPRPGPEPVSPALAGRLSTTAPPGKPGPVVLNSKGVYKIFPCIRNALLGFPGGTVVKNPPANAGDMGSSPGPGRSHMPRSNEARAPQLLNLRSTAHERKLPSPRAATTEARAPRARAPQREATAMRSLRTAMKSSPGSLQLEKARVQQQKKPNTAKIFKN